MTALIAGPVIGSTLYAVGGFMLPFLCVGCVGIILAVCLVYAIPTGEYDRKNDIKGHNTEKLSWSNVLKVIQNSAHNIQQMHQGNNISVFVFII